MFPAVHPIVPPASLTSRWQSWVELLAQRFAPRGGVALSRDEQRRLRLFIGLSVLGLLFGSLFGGFYLLIGHRGAALIVVGSTVAITVAPGVVRSRGLTAAGNFYALFLAAGFIGLASIEGGMRGHAIAWLAVVPLCACILVGRRSGAVWCAVCLAAVTGFWVLELRGVPVPSLYPPTWESFISGAGYLTLTLFMTLLGLFYEGGRRRSLKELQAALRELSTANERLQMLDAERREFLGIAAHDLRGPMTLIHGHAQLGAFQNAANPMVARSFEQILVAGGRMRDLLDRFLGERAIEDGRMELRPEICNVEELVSAAVANHLPYARNKQIPLVHRPAGLPMWVRADPKAVGQILENLISNALKFSPPGCPVEVRTRLDHPPGAGTGVIMEVADSGPGIGEDEMGRLFDKFTRLSARPTGGESSTGLGLFIVKRLAAAIGGTVSCRSRPGEGATFVLVLPGSAAPPATRDDKRITQRLLRQTRRVLAGT